MSDRPDFGPLDRDVRGRTRYRPLPPYNPFPTSLLPGVAADYVAASAEAIGCDPALVALPALAVLAGCIGNSRALVVKHGWIEPAVVWAVSVALSGDLKTPAYKTVTEALVDLQYEELDRAREKTEEYNRRCLERAALDKDQRGEEPEEPPDPPSYYTSDTTIEALADLLQDNPRGLLLMRDELDGWFRSFTRYKTGGASDRPHWLELHNAGTLTIHRMREPKRVDVRRAAVSITGTIQPAVLTEALDQSALASGLGARFLMAMPPRRQKQWREAEVAEDLQKQWSQTLKRLLGLRLKEDGRKRKPHYLGMDGPAKRAWVGWYNEWAKEQHKAEGAQAAAWAKLEAYSARLALLHHIVSRAHLAEGRYDGVDKTPISQESMAAAIELTKWFANETRRIYAVLAETHDETRLRNLIEFILSRGGKITVAELQRSNVRKWQTADMAREALEELVTLGLAYWREGKPRPSGGHCPKWLILKKRAYPSYSRPDRKRKPAGDGAYTCPPASNGNAEKPSEYEQEYEAYAAHHAGRPTEGAEGSGTPADPSVCSNGQAHDDLDDGRGDAWDRD